MKISNVIKTKTKGYVYIDTCQLTDTFGNMLDNMGFGNSDANAFEYETMVFECDKNGKVKNWKDLDHKNFSNKQDGKKIHKKMIAKWKIK